MQNSLLWGGLRGYLERAHDQNSLLRFSLPLGGVGRQLSWFGFRVQRPFKGFPLKRECGVQALACHQYKPQKAHVLALRSPVRSLKPLIPT